MMFVKERYLQDVLDAKPGGVIRIDAEDTGTGAIVFCGTPYLLTPTLTTPLRPRTNCRNCGAPPEDHGHVCSYCLT
jgi:hypothetical protein